MRGASCISLWPMRPGAVTMVADAGFTHIRSALLADFNGQIDNLVLAARDDGRTPWD